jgi:hypothetical protein
MVHVLQVAIMDISLQLPTVSNVMARVLLAQMRINV